MEDLPHLFIHSAFVLFLVCFGSTGVGTQGFTLTLYCLSHASSPFFSGLNGLHGNTPIL
jgi:hypothetical protein